MRWYERLYVGEKAAGRRYRVIRAVRRGKISPCYVLTPPSNERNVLDILPAMTLSNALYKKRDLLIIGVGADYEDAVFLAARIVTELYRETKGFDLMPYLEGKLIKE